MGVCVNRVYLLKRTGEASRCALTGEPIEVCAGFDERGIYGDYGFPQAELKKKGIAIDECFVFNTHAFTILTIEEYKKRPCLGPLFILLKFICI